MRRDPLAFLGSSSTRSSSRACSASCASSTASRRRQATFDHRSGRQSLVEQLSRADDAPQAARARRSKRSQRFGVGSGSVRTIAGTMAIHMELERRLAEFKKTEAVVVFQSGFTANAGTVSSILTKDDVVVSDELNHASIIDGCRLSRADDQGVPAQGRRRRAHGSSQALPAGAAQAAHHRRRVQHGRRPRAAAGAVRSGRRVRLHHDGRRCARERRVRRERARHDRSFRHARPRRHPGRHAVEGDRRARRLRRRQRSR